MNEHLPVIISSKLYFDQESKLLQVLKKNNKGIWWILDDIYDISPCMCMHRISLEDVAKAVRQPHNLLILDIVKDEIMITCLFNTFTYQRFFFDPGIKDEDTNKNFKFNGHYPKLLHGSPTLEEENIEDISLEKAAYVITYPPWLFGCVLSFLSLLFNSYVLSLRTMHV